MKIVSPRTGRPRLNDPNSKNLTIRISNELSEKLDKYCRKNKVTKGETVRKGIEKVLAEKEK